MYDFDLVYVGQSLMPIPIIKDCKLGDITWPSITNSNANLEIDGRNEDLVDKILNATDKLEVFHLHRASLELSMNLFCKYKRKI